MPDPENKGSSTEKEPNETKYLEFFDPDFYRKPINVYLQGASRQAEKPFEVVNLNDVIDRLVDAGKISLSAEEATDAIINMPEERIKEEARWGLAALIKDASPAEIIQMLARIKQIEIILSKGQLKVNVQFIGTSDLNPNVTFVSDSDEEEYN